MKIIVQAGGKGTRLQQLTANKPKCLVSVNNRPIIFHLFEKYKNYEFIIIADYKFDVIEKYLDTFAKVKYRLIKTIGNGNICGIKKALDFVNSDEKFMIIWSDLLISDEFQPENLPDDNYIGILENQICSWSFKDGILDKVSSDKFGVGGCFLFKNKTFLENIPDNGSFTSFLKEKKISLKPIKMINCFEIGTLEAVETRNSYYCRPYNKIEFKNSTVIKTGITLEGQKLIEKEVVWYKKMQEYKFDAIPKIFSYEPLSMEEISGTNIFQANLTKEQKFLTLNNLIKRLNELHSFEEIPANKDDLIKEYYSKTIDRLNSIKMVLPFAENKYIKINGQEYKNPIIFKDNFKQSVEKNLLDTFFCPIHGDSTLTNSMTDKNNDIYFIDPRGYFGSQQVFGDVRYDWAKLYYSLAGNFDRFNIKDFYIKILKNEIEFKIKSNRWEDLTETLFNNIKNCTKEEIKFIHSIIWLSLASHCWDDYDAMCLAFYNGIVLVNEFI